MGRRILLAFVLCCLNLACSGSDGDDDAGGGAGDDDGSPAGDDDDNDNDDNDAAPPWTEPAAPLRESRSLDGTWSYTPEGCATRDVPVPCFWEAVPSWPGWEQYACPEYTVGTPDENVEISEGANWAERAIHHAVYELDIDLPAPAPTTRLRFEAIHHAAAAYLNEQAIGEHIGAYREATFDASAAAVAGVNRLRVEVTDGQALLGDDGVTRWPVGWYSLTDITGIYRSVTLESLPAIYVADSFIVPSVRRGDVTAQHTLVNASDIEARLWLIDRAVNADGEVELETAAQQATVPAHGQVELVVVAPWDSPRLWSPIDPHLYTLRTLVMSEAGAPLDLREDRFGFRETWIEGGHYVLNGARLNLLGDSIEDHSQRPRYWAQQYFDCSTARDTLQRIKDLNINAVRFHQAPPQQCVLDIADELGLLVIAESAVYARDDILPPFNRNEEYAANAALWIGDWVRRQRRHPSIVVWSLENEMFMYWFALGMSQIYPLRLPAQDADSIQRDDAGRTTPRPVNWDGDSSFLWHWFPAEPETVNWHYPNNRYFTIAPDREWYDDALAHFAPYLIEAAPTGVGETMVDRRDPWGDHTPDQVKAMQGIAVRAMRILGFSDMRPYHLSWAWHFFYPDGTEHPYAPYYHSLYTPEEKDRLVQIIRESYHPIAVFDREYTRATANLDGTIGPVGLAPNAAIARTLVVLNDSFLPGQAQTVAWSVVDETSGDTLAEDQFETLVELGGRVERDIAFDTPAVDEPHDLRLTINCSLDGLPQGDFATTYAFVVGE